MGYVVKETIYRYSDSRGYRFRQNTDPEVCWSLEQWTDSYRSVSIVDVSTVTLVALEYDNGTTAYLYFNNENFAHISELSNEWLLFMLKCSNTR